jgi:hypothetical protein
LQSSVFPPSFAFILLDIDMARDRKFGPIKIEQEKKRKKPQEQKKALHLKRK